MYKNRKKTWFTPITKIWVENVTSQLNVYIEESMHGYQIGVDLLKKKKTKQTLYAYKKWKMAGW